MTIDQKVCPFPLFSSFLAILESEIARAPIPAQTGVILNFRDPGYSPENCGFHPVEINISSLGRILYITDFSYVGPPPFAELAKELDFDFSLGIFQHLSREFPIHAGRDLFALWQGNFVVYYRMGVYSVSAEKY